MGLRWAAGQLSEFGFGQGDVFAETSTGRKMLTALANQTEGFLRGAISNDRLDKETVALIRQDIMRPSGGTTDANALAQLKQTTRTMLAARDRINNILENPRDYKDTQVTKARETINLIDNLVDNYNIAINGYDRAFAKSGVNDANKVLKNIFNRRKVNN